MFFFVLCRRRAGINMASPAKDIPPVAQELLKQKGMSFIVDTAAPVVPISVLRERIPALDLSRSALRAPSELHLRYLRKMGVKASMTVAIVVRGELWGLFNFHSYTTAVHPSCEDRVLVDLVATIAPSLMKADALEHATAEGIQAKNCKPNRGNRVGGLLGLDYGGGGGVLGLDEGEGNSFEGLAGEDDAGGGSFEELLFLRRHCRTQVG